jgi:hypothetical protein
MVLTCLLALATTQLDPARAMSPLGGDYWQGTDAPPGEVWGVADLHAHFFNYLGFGGRVLHGTPSAPNGMRQALHSCRANHGEDARGFITAILPDPAHRTSGYPRFEGWPRYDTLIHQQAYVDWVRRAWQGGLRLVQMDGTILDIGGEAMDAPGLDLLGLVVGSEGQLGIVTEATVRILRMAEDARPVLFGFATSEDAAACVAAIIGAGIIPVAMEFMDKEAIAICEAFAKAGYPLDAGAMLIIEVEGSAVEMDSQLKRIVDIAHQHNVQVVRESKTRGPGNYGLDVAWAGEVKAFPVSRDEVK